MRQKAFHPGRAFHPARRRRQRRAKHITNAIAALFDNDKTQPRSIAATGARRTVPAAASEQTWERAPQESGARQSRSGEAEEAQEIRPTETALQQAGQHLHMGEAVSVPSIHEHPQCEIAKAKVGKYAFADVEALSCEGEIYRFSATRDGKRFEVRVRAANGDLLGVEKLQQTPPANEAKPPVVRSQAQARP